LNSPQCPGIAVILAGTLITTLGGEGAKLA
jgi:hypothetical protein